MKFAGRVRLDKRRAVRYNDGINQDCMEAFAWHNNTISTG